MSETGHAKNTANFEILTNVVTTLGSAYNPTNNELKLPNLITVLADAKSSLASIQEVFSHWKDTTNQREIAFDSAEKLSTRAVSSFAVSGADALDVTDAKSFVRKMQGKRAKAKPEPKTAGEAIKTHSASQTSFDNKTEHFAQVVSILGNSPKHKPNEVELQTDSLSSTLDDLRAKNTAVINASVSLANQRINRNQILYDNDNGLVKIAQDVKTYVKSVFGPASPQYKQISGLAFKNMGK
jgi:hypothetical protein